MDRTFSEESGFGGMATAGVSDSHAVELDDFDPLMPRPTVTITAKTTNAPTKLFGLDSDNDDSAGCGVASIVAGCEVASTGDSSTGGTGYPQPGQNRAESSNVPEHCKQV